MESRGGDPDHRLSSGGSGPSCGRCGSPLHAGSSGGVCPHCALGDLFGATSEEPDPSAEDTREDGEARADAARYTDATTVGRGGMGEVRRVFDRRLGRRLAMKVLRDDVVAGATPRSQEAAQRFAAEARITAQLDHPGVVPVYEFEHDDQGRPYFTMKHVDGQELRTAIQAARAGRSDVSLGDVVQSLTRLCETLAFAHDRGVVHRDVKSTNVMLGRFGEVYLMDWGVAKRVGERPRSDDTRASVGVHDALLTAPGQVLGTPCSMAPEQAAGAPSSPAGDIYAVGALLYELLTGHLPYLARDPCRPASAVLDDLRSGPPPPIAEFDPDAPPELAAISEKAMARDPSHRYASAWDLRRDLRSYLDGRVVAAHRTGLAAEFGKWVRRNRALSMSCAAGLLVALAGVAAYVVASGSAARSALASAKRETAARHRAEGQRLAAVSTTYLGSEPDVALHLAVSAAQLAPGHESTTALYAALGAAREMRRLEGHDGYVTGAAFDPAGDLLASAEREGLVVVWNSRSGALLRRLLMPGERQWGLAFAPSGRRLATASRAGNSGRLRLWDIDTGKPVWTIEGPEFAVSAIACSPDGARIAVRSEAGALFVVDAADGTRISAMNAAGAVQRPLDLLWVEGRDLAVVDAVGTVRVYDAATGAAVAELADDAAPDAPSSPARIYPGPSGDALVVASGASLRVWRPRTGEVLSRVDLGGGDVRTVGAGGTRAVLARRDGAELLLVDVATGAEHGVLSTVQTAGDSVIAPRGDAVAFKLPENAIGLWQPAAVDEPLRVLRGHLYGVTRLRFAPDGLRLASASRDRTVRVWAVEPVDADAEGPHCERLGTAVLGAVELLRRTDPSGTSSLVARESGSCGELNSMQFDFGGGVLEVRLAPRGEAAVVRTDTSASLVDLRQARIVCALDPALHDWRYTRDGRWCAASRARGGKGVVPVFEGHRGDKLYELPFPDETVQVFSVDAMQGTAVVRPYKSSRVLEVWDLLRGRLVSRLAGHSGTLLGAAQSRDGEWIVTTAMDRSVRFWDAHSGEALGAARGLDMVRYDLEISPADGFVAASSREETVLLRGPTGERIGLIRAGRSVSFDERQGRFFTRGGGRRRTWPFPSALQYSAAGIETHELDVDFYERFGLEGVERAEAVLRAGIYATYSATALERRGRRWLESGDAEAAEHALRRAAGLRQDRAAGPRSLAAWYAYTAGRAREQGDTGAAEVSTLAAIAQLELALRTGETELGALVADDLFAGVFADPLSQRLDEFAADRPLTGR